MTTNRKSLYKYTNVTDKVLHKKLSYILVGVLFDIYNELGYGYHEKHYEKAIEKELLRRKIPYKRQLCCKLVLKGEEIGKYYFDFLIDDKIVLEIKRGNYFSRKNIDQVKGYLKVVDLQLGILANFTQSGIKFMRILNIR